MSKKPSHRRIDSEELDVFEAANYFSGYNDNNINNYLVSQKAVSKEERRGYLREGRVSLDVPSLKHYYIHQHNNPLSIVEQQQQQQQQQQKSKDKKKYKQPSSPGGKIAQFLNSLFSQTNSKNKKSSNKSSSLKDEDESPINRRKRRSSISHFRSTSSAIDARSMYSTSSSGFRTPPPYNLNTPTKSCKDFRNFSDYKDVLATLSKYKIQGNGNNNGIPKDDHNNNNNKVMKGSSNNNIDWIDEKLRMVEKSKNYNNNNNNNNNISSHVVYQEKKENYKKFDQHDDEDGADSDSSSDLFELRIDYEFGFCSSGLPVYETTHMDNIKRSSATSVPIKT
ncbi:protein BIG GRAIN 1-like E [Chenopodium quinoa]|uniref:protein BIG GRAIN 1-like E n=1 Tax=Chenopodium quinoa TaxID=63459 RepID=UPI000B7803E9|nr:protein BIG GRAIN 1-like E [Chenopodium quinoa]